MKDETLQAREWFLEELKKRAEKSGKRLNIMGRAAYEQRIEEEMPPNQKGETTMGKSSHSGEVEESTTLTDQT